MSLVKCQNFYCEMATTTRVPISQLRTAEIVESLCRAAEVVESLSRTAEVVESPTSQPRTSNIIPSPHQHQPAQDNSPSPPSSHTYNTSLAHNSTPFLLSPQDSGIPVSPHITRYNSIIHSRLNGTTSAIQNIEMRGRRSTDRSFLTRVQFVLDPRLRTRGNTSPAAGA